MPHNCVEVKWHCRWGPIYDEPVDSLSHALGFHEIMRRASRAVDSVDMPRLVSGDRSSPPIQGTHSIFQGLIFNCSIVVSNLISNFRSPHK